MIQTQNGKSYIPWNASEICTWPHSSSSWRSTPLWWWVDPVCLVGQCSAELRILSRCGLQWKVMCPFVIWWLLQGSLNWAKELWVGFLSPWECSCWLSSLMSARCHEQRDTWMPRSSFLVLESHCKPLLASWFQKSFQAKTLTTRATFVEKKRCPCMSLCSWRMGRPPEK